jgi:hypothetical protein
MFITTTEETSLDSSTETTKAMTSALKFKNLRDITFHRQIESNRVGKEMETENLRKQPSTTAGDEADDEMNSTTVESSTNLTSIQENYSPDYVALSPPTLANSNYHPSLSPLPYPQSKNPSANQVSITYSPHQKPYQSPIRNRYKFYPSQPDYNHHLGPYCINMIHHKFIPVLRDSWSINSKRK